MLGLLVVLIILGGLAATLLSVQNGPSSSHRATRGIGADQPGTAPSDVANDIRAAAVAMCHTTYEEVVQAVSVYKSEHGTAPKSMSDLAGVLQGVPTSQYFTITIDERRAGQVDVTTKAQGLQPGETNCAFAG